MGHCHDRLQLRKQSPSHHCLITRAVAGLPRKVGISSASSTNIDWEKQRRRDPWTNASTLDEEGYMDYIHERLKGAPRRKYGEIANNGMTWVSQT